MKARGLYVEHMKQYRYLHPSVFISSQSNIPTFVIICVLMGRGCKYARVICRTDAEVRLQTTSAYSMMRVQQIVCSRMQHLHISARDATNVNMDPCHWRQVVHLIWWLSSIDTSMGAANPATATRASNWGSLQSWSNSVTTEQPKLSNQEAYSILGVLVTSDHQVGDEMFKQPLLRWGRNHHAGISMKWDERHEAPASVILRAFGKPW